MEINIEFGIDDYFWYSRNRQATRKVVQKIFITQHGISLYNYGVNEYDIAEVYIDKCYLTKDACNLAIIEGITQDS